MLQVECVICGQQFNTYPSRLLARKAAGPFCSKHCYGVHLTTAQLGEQGPRWKGNEVSKEGARHRARVLFPEVVCTVCGDRGERHHKNGCTLDNDPSNIALLCRKHHMQADGRLRLVRDNIRRLQKVSTEHRRRKTLEITLPSVLVGIGDLIDRGIKPTQKNCKEIKGFPTINNLFHMGDLIRLSTIANNDPTTVVRLPDPQ